MELKATQKETQDIMDNYNYLLRESIKNANKGNLEDRLCLTWIQLEEWCQEPEIIKESKHDDYNILTVEYDEELNHINIAFELIKNEKFELHEIAVRNSKDFKDIFHKVGLYLDKNCLKRHIVEKFKLPFKKRTTMYRYFMCNLKKKFCLQKNCKHICNTISYETFKEKEQFINKCDNFSIIKDIFKKE